jgi:hypothetical protein
MDWAIRPINPLIFGLNDYASHSSAESGNLPTFSPLQSIAFSALTERLLF